MRRIFLVGHHSGFRAVLAMTIRDQSAGTLGVVGEACQIAGSITVIAAAQPDAVVIILGFESSCEQAMVAMIRHLIPGCCVIVIETREGVAAWPEHPWGQADALLQAEHLATELVPMLRRLAVYGRASSSKGADPHTASAPQE
ncbi:MAG: hypothetical protein HGA45_05055 [Chloroflexales bacterium]|nr:hypothetical protein [Chloroflexales bacterium]